MSETLEMTAFGPFRLDTDRRQLLRDGESVALSSRAFDILVLLVEHRGRVVTKDEIMTGVWRGMIVEENNLAVQISALRRALAAGAGETQLILTVPGQGYRFVGRLNQRGAPETVARDNAPLPIAAQQSVAIPAIPEFAQAGTVRAGSDTIQQTPVISAARPIPAWRSTASVAALAAGMLALVAFELLRPGAPAPATQVPAPPRLSIAVLPFRDLSDDRCCDYLADAISDDLTTDLSLIPGSVVIARESSDVFRGHATPAGEIGRTLNVRYLLEGSLRAVDGQFSINAQLIEAASGGHLWAERFTVPRAHLADAQNVIVQRLASALGVKLVDIEGARSMHEHPDNPDALDFFLRARSIMDRSDTLDSMNQAQTLLEQALAKQPDDVKALSEMGWLLSRKVNNFADPRRENDLAEARNVVQRAIKLAPHDAGVLAAKAALQLVDYDCANAQATFQEALDGQPNSVRAMTGLAACKIQLGQFADAVTTLTTLLRVDPESPRTKTRYYHLGFAKLMLDDPQGALPWLRKSIAGEPDPAPGAADLSLAGWTRLALIAATRMTGDTAGSDRLYATYKRIWPNGSSWALEARSPKSLSGVPGFRHFLAALQDAGMPRFADENPGPATSECAGAMFTPTPHAIPGVRTVGTAELAALMRDGHPLVVDLGVTGAAVPLKAQLSTADPASGADMAALLNSAPAAGAQAIVVMGSSALDPRGCQAAALLAKTQGTQTEAGQPGLVQPKPILWYRGGEEAWAQAEEPFEDRR